MNTCFRVETFQGRLQKGFERIAADSETGHKPRVDGRNDAVTIGDLFDRVKCANKGERCRSTKMIESGLCSCKNRYPGLRAAHDQCLRYEQ